MRAPQSSPSNHSRGRHQRRAGLHGERGRPPIIRAFCPKNSTSIPLAGEVAVGDQADQAAGAQPLGQDAERAAAAGQREHLEAQRSAERAGTARTPTRA